MEAALIAFVVALVIIFARIPVAIALAAVGFGGYWIMLGLQPALTMLTITASGNTLNYSLSVVPLFILMGNLIAGAGVAGDLYAAAQTFIGRMRGGLAMATIASSGGFSAVSGSAVATAVTIGKIAIPSMRKLGYSDTLNTSSVAAGATLGVLIPPSVVMVIYGIQTETNIGRLFAAGIIPGILGIILYSLAVRWVVWRDPKAVPVTEFKSTWRDKLRAISKTWSIVLLFAVVMGGIYAGFFTATEAGGIGAVGAFIIAVLRRTSAAELFAIFKDSVHLSAMLFALIVGAGVFSEFINLTGADRAVLAFINEVGVSPLLAIATIIVIYLLLGAVMEELSMILLTLPMFFPIVIGLGYDPVWFGIIVVVMVQLGLITPPIGLNLFIVKKIAGDVSLGQIYKGILPFVTVDLVRVVLLVAAPVIVLWLPDLLFN